MAAPDIAFLNTSGHDRVALVTGATSGLGLATAVELARHEFRVFGGFRDPARVALLTGAAAAAGVGVEPVELDVRRPGCIAAAVARIERCAGPIDVLINNAAIAVDGYFEDVSDAELREQFETNFFGVANVTRAVVPGMRERRSGRLINVSSISARFGRPGFSPYCSSKWALEGLSESLHYELLPFGVHVILIEPGSFKSDIHTRNRMPGRRATLETSPNREAFQRMERALDDLLSTAEGPSSAARTIVRAALTPKPQLRYVIGWDARKKALARALLPSNVFSRAVRRWG